MSKRAKEGQLPAIYGTSTNTPQDQGRLPCQNVHQQAAPGHIRHFNQYPLKSGMAAMSKRAPTSSSRPYN
ncbi:hypothetical protein [Lentilactobacillus diolivorans]|uniref:Uncharacterized protein n=1 Tax=Lentilactobacillus diolivorans DSM 14421 TaxID=1423739 RepID=A0A0R1SS51_9LACO|nr:hypothetical protein [Lentilactobacillus diolivorans]KRL68027.1 hypothetical protein FC85_GL002548 [Lentilactobacillus diolivorans DSM 14421]